METFFNLRLSCQLAVTEAMRAWIAVC
jgi:hypothetical protein